MGFLNNLVSGENSYFTMIVALAIVVALIVLAVWLIKVLGQATRTVGRGRQKRLSIVDSVPIDQKRQAVIVRRDDVEHLIVIGGANDLVVETGFEAPPLPTPAARQARWTTRPGKPETPSIDSATGAPPGKSRSLRHTGLLRGTADNIGELPGGKPEQAPAVLPDSDTSGMSRRGEPALEIIAEAGDSDNAGTSNARRK